MRGVRGDEYCSSADDCKTIKVANIPRTNPLHLYAELESLVYRICQHRNVSLFPFGPKIFALCSILVANAHPEAAVWRGSAEGLEHATDRLASDFFFGLEVCFPPATAD